MSWDEGASDLPKDPWPYGPTSAKAAEDFRAIPADIRRSHDVIEVLTAIAGEIERRALAELQRRSLPAPPT